MRTKIFNWLQCPARYGPSSTLLPHLNKLVPVIWGGRDTTNDYEKEEEEEKEEGTLPRPVVY